MSIPLPELDQRTWADLVEEGVARAPKYAPTWTDQNAHDPGITLVELLAFKFEQSIYRANRVTALLQRRFLELAGPAAVPQGLRAARADMTFSLTGNGDGLWLPAGLLFLVRGNATAPPPLLVARADPAPAPLRLRHAVYVHPLSIQAVQTSAGGASYADVTKLWHQEVPFPAWGDDPIDPSKAPAGPTYPPALYLALDRLPATGVPLCVRVALDRPGPARDERARLVAALFFRARARTGTDARMIADPSTEMPPEHECWTGLPSARADDRLPDGDDPPVVTVWEYWNGTIWRALDAEDPTRGLTLDGTVRLKIPESDATLDRSKIRLLLGVVPVASAYIRCRLASGRPDVSPSIARIQVNTVEVEQVMPATAPTQAIPSSAPNGRSTVIGPSASPSSPGPWAWAAHSSETHHDVSITDFVTWFVTSTGGPGTSGPQARGNGQAPSAVKVEVGNGPFDAVLKTTKIRVWFPDSTHFSFPAQVVIPDSPLNDGTTLLTLTNTSVVEGSLRLVSIEPSDRDNVSWILHSWRPVAADDLALALPTDAVYSLDPSSGTVRFGDGVHGRAVPAGTQFLASYDITCGARGNPSPRGVWDVVGATATPPTQSGTVGATAAAPTRSVPVGPGSLSQLAAPLADWNAGLRRVSKIENLPGQVPYQGVVLGPIAGDPARAGIDAELLDDAIARLAASTKIHENLAALAATNSGTLDGLDLANVLNQQAPRQAVTAADLERLTLDTPGATVLRARAFPETDPDLPGLAASGTVTLVIVPGLPKKNPTPTANLIRRVNAHLQRARGLGTRLRLVGPVYTPRDISATLRITTEYVLGDAERALSDWLDPLGDGGDYGSGPPVFGRDIFPSDVLTLLASVAGVSEVDNLTVTASADAPELWAPWSLPACGKITLKTEAAR